MKLKFNTPFLSITENFWIISISDFTVLTWLNWSWKTHILKNIISNNISVLDENDAIIKNIAFFDYNDFTVKQYNQKQNNNQNQPKPFLKLQDQTYYQNIINQIRGDVQLKLNNLNNPNIWQIYTYFFQNIVSTNLDFVNYKKKDINKFIKENLDKYNKKEWIEKEIWENIKKFLLELKEIKHFNKYYKISKKRKLHLITQLQWTHFINNESYLWQQIQEEFKQYQIKFCQNTQKRAEDLEYETKTYLDKANFEKQNWPAPWDLFNDILNIYDCNWYYIDPKTLPRLQVGVWQEKFSMNLVLTNKDSWITTTVDNLSSWEKTLLALALNIYQQKNKNWLPEILLLDEIDSSLHPSMIKQLLNALNEVFVLEYWMKIIMVTHSPTTVALTDEKSIYVVQKWSVKEKIIKNSNNEALKTLSEWFATIQEWKIYFENILSSKKDCIIFTEWKTDIKHISIARDKLWFSDVDFDIFSCWDAWKLKQFLMWIPKGLFEDKVIIWIFDYDDKWLKELKWLNGLVEEKKHYKRKDMNNIHWISLICPNIEFEKHENCFIEFLYSKENIDKLTLDWFIEKRRLWEVNNILGDKGISSTDLNWKKDLWFYQLWKNADKNKFSNDIEDFKKEDFKNFEPLFEKIKNIFNDIKKQWPTQ